jgi:chromosomal replication initiation ATPase DnaA
MTEQMDSQTSISQDKVSKDFVKSIKQYLYGFDLNKTDERRIAALFIQHADRVSRIRVKKVYVPRYEKVPVYIDLQTNIEIPRQTVAPNKIIEFIRKETGLGDFNTNTTRQRKYVEARQMCIFLMKNFTTLTLIEIGDFFNSKNTRSKKQDHTTVIHGIRQGKYLILNIAYFTEMFHKFKTDFNVYNYSDLPGDTQRTN